VIGTGTNFETGLDAALYVSSDGGLSWVEIPGLRDAMSPDTTFTRRYRIEINANGDLFAFGPPGSGTAGVQRSTDGGATWTLLFQAAIGSDMVMDANGVLYVAAATFSATRGIHKSVDDGDTWTRVFDQSSEFAEIVNGVDLFVGANFAAAKLSVDGGASFTNEVNFGVAIGTGPPGHLAVGTFNGDVHVSTDTGATWTSSDQGLPSSSSTGLVGASSHAFWAGYTYSPPLGPGGLIGGLYHSENGGASWSPRSDGLDAANTEVVLLHSGGGIFGGNRTRGIVAGTLDTGVTWDGGVLPGTAPTLLDLAEDPSNGDLYAGSFGEVARSSDGGLTWESLGAADIGSSVNAVLVASDGTILAGGSGQGVLRSTDGGLSFTVTQTGPSTNHIVEAPNGVLLASVFNSGIVKSDDGGATWTTISDGLTPTAKALTVAPNGDYFAAPGGVGQGIIRSTDEGVSWNEVGDIPRGSGGLAPIDVLDIEADVDGVLYARVDYMDVGDAQRKGIFTSQDDGATWQSANQGVSPNILVHGLEVSTNGDVALATSAGIYLRMAPEPDAGLLATTSVLVLLALAYRRGCAR
jgi:hypothetical protein